MLVSKLSPYINEIIGDHPCGFWLHTLTDDRIFSFVIYWEKTGFNETAHQLFVDFKKAGDSLRMEVLHNNLIEFWVHMKLG
jgi:hypothetical protein